MPFSIDVKTELDRAMHALVTNVMDGLAHGYFDYSVHCEKGSGNKRILTINTGKSHKFSIPPDDLKE
jgi:hypothetical protein